MSGRLLALLALLAAVPLRAQNVRITGEFAPIQAPAIGGLGSQFAISPFAPSPLTAAPSLVPALSAPSLAPIIAPPLMPEPVPVALAAGPSGVIPAAAKADMPGGPGGPRRAKTPAIAFHAATPTDGWAGRFNFKPAGNLFDGAREITDETGAVYAAVPKGDGAVRLHIVQRGPNAAPKAVPGTEGLTGKPLLDALNAFVSKGHNARTYEETSDYMFSTANQVVINGVKGIVDAYSGIFVPGTSKEGSDYPEPGDVNGDGFPDRAGMNVEHTWPQTLFQKALPQRSDIHHLETTFMHPNSVRGHMPFGVVVGKPDYENKAGAKRGLNAAGQPVFEPPDAVKGRIARDQLYFYSRHKDSRLFGRTSVVYWNQQIALFMKWNREFPPDTFEARRNDLSQTWQGNRNPFVDDHLLADRVGAEDFRAENPARGPDAASLRPSGDGSGKRFNGRSGGRSHRSGRRSRRR